MNIFSDFSDSEDAIAPSFFRKVTESKKLIFPFFLLCTPFFFNPGIRSIIEKLTYNPKNPLSICFGYLNKDI